MTLSTLLQALISIIFIYLILALLTSELQEYLATFSEARAKRLKQSIRQMLGEKDYPLYPLELSQGKTIPINQDSKIWIKDGQINPVSNVKVVFDNSIWINNSDQTEVEANNVIEDTANQGKGFIKGEAVTKGQKDIWLDANQQEVDADTVIEDLVNLGNFYVKGEAVNKNEQSIWKKDSDQTEVEANNVIEDPANSGTGFIKGLVVTQGQKDIWLANQQEVDENIVIEYPVNSGNFYVKGEAVTKFPVQKGVNSLTEKLYQHPNIKALNQSSVAWLSILKQWGKTRISYGPSYIEDPKF